MAPTLKAALKLFKQRFAAESYMDFKVCTIHLLEL